MSDLPLVDMTQQQIFPLDELDRRLEHLAEADRRLLAQAAVVGETFSAEPLAVLANADLITVLQQLDRLARRTGLIVADGQRFRFTHGCCREALLASTSPALTEAYRRRLSHAPTPPTAQDSALAPLDSGNSVQEVEALIRTGDLSEWRDKLEFYTQALWLTHRKPAVVMHTRRLLYERIGDLQQSAREPQIARGYYEAALSTVPGPEGQIRLLCRIAETYRAESTHLPEFHSCLRQADQLLKQVHDPGTRVYPQCLRAEIALARNNLRQARRLADQICQTQGAPEEVLLRAHHILMTLAGMHHDYEEIQRQAQAIPSLSPGSWTKARHLCSVASAYREAGRFRQALECTLQASQLLEKLGRGAEVSECLTTAGLCALNMGDCESARAYLLQGIRRRANQVASAFAYSLLCRSWWFDRTPEGIEWAGKYLDTCERSWLSQAPRDLCCGMELHRFGLSERIYRDAGDRREFRDRLESMRRHLAVAGYQVEGIWYLGDAVERPPLPAADHHVDWQWIPGAPGNRYTWRDRLILSCPPLRGFLQMDMPRFLHAVSGDFALQVTLPGADEIIPEYARCRSAAAQGSLAEVALGGGGLLLLGERKDALRIFAHLQVPGEVICTIRQEGQDRTLGRGLLPDGPVRLRLERTGDTIHAYAGSEKEWFLCGQIDLPGWGQVQVGIFGECLIELYPFVQRAETRFTDIRMQTASKPICSAVAPDTFFALPDPVCDPDLPEFVAAGPQMQRLLQQIRTAAAHDAPILVWGETGTGKELVARALHRFGDRRDGPFIPLNCATLPTELLERELFGHQRGAFTGAYETREGLFEAADGGVLLLDEIGDTSPQFQARLLRVIEEQAIRRLGDTRLRQVSVRVVAATHRDLAQLVRTGEFRSDLYYRLKGDLLTVPPLRRRIEEIPHLTHHILRRWAQQRKVVTPTITVQAMEVLRDHTWPGNVRELIHEIERAATAAKGGPISLQELSIRRADASGAEKSNVEQQARCIVAALQAAGGNRSEAARRLGISRVTLYRRIRRWGLEDRL